MLNSNMTKTVEEITGINFSGNVIPQIWFSFIKFPSGKPDLLGIMLLAEIVYWYRATEIRDESTGQVIGHKKKFKADKLQRHYQPWADQYGVSKRQVQDATRRLKEAGLIKIELRVVTPETGMVLSNVPFFEPVPSEVEKITYPSSTSTFERGSCNQLHEGMYSNVRGHVIDYMTYTETTTKINNDDESHPARKIISDSDPMKILSSYGIKISSNNPASKICLLELKKYTPEQIHVIARVLREKGETGMIKNAAGLLMTDPSLCEKILSGKFYPDVEPKKKKPKTTRHDNDEYELYVPSK